MKYVKTFESVNSKYEIGDYVICKEKSGDILNKFLLNNIGQIVDINYREEHPYVIKYEDIPEILSGRFDEVVKKDDPDYTYKDRRVMKYQEIIYHSKNKKDLEPFILSNKFNI